MDVFIFPPFYNHLNALCLFLTILCIVTARHLIFSKSPLLFSMTQNLDLLGSI